MERLTLRSMVLQKKEIHEASGSKFPRSGPDLDNHILAQASPVLCQLPSWAASPSFSSPALQPSILSSTVNSSLFSSSTSSLFLSYLANPEKKTLLDPSLCQSGLSSPRPVPRCHEQEKRKKSVAEKKIRLQNDSVCSFQGIQSTGADSIQDLEHEDLLEKDQGLPSEMTVPDLKLTEIQEKEEDEEKEETDFVDTFGDIEQHQKEDELKYKKYKLLNVVCCSLVNKKYAPGQKSWNKPRSIWTKIKSLCDYITCNDPEFILKLAVYTRHELKCCLMTSFLLALAAHLPDSKPHLRRYFCSVVLLPSDWLAVVRIYTMCFSPSLPSCLKKALVDKFKQFSEHQLAKHITRNARCQHKWKRSKALNMSNEQLLKWAKLVNMEVSDFKKYLKVDVAVGVQQSEFTFKKLIKRLHIKEPAELVMSILGKKYPADLKAYARSGLSGVWQSERAGQRMKLKSKLMPTWHSRLRREGKKAATWQKIIDIDSLPLVGILKNLRKMINLGISAKHHNKILEKLASKSDVMQSGLLPFHFLTAYKVIQQLSENEPSPKGLLRGLVLKLRRSRSHLDWESVTRKRPQALKRLPCVYRIYNAKRKRLQRARQKPYTQELLERYRKSLDEALKISCKYNVPLIPGHTLICCPVDAGSSRDWKDAEELFLPPELSTNTEGIKLSVSAQESMFLMTVLISYCCEHSQVVVTNYHGFQDAHLKSDSFFGNVDQLIKHKKALPVRNPCLVDTGPHSVFHLKYQRPKPEKRPSDLASANLNHNTPKIEEDYSSEGWTSFPDFFLKLAEAKCKVNNIIKIDEYCEGYYSKMDVNRYRKNCDNDVLLVNLILSASTHWNNRGDPNVVFIYDIHESVLKFISERGSPRIMHHIEHIDKLHNIPLPVGGRTRSKPALDIVPLPATPKTRWREVRVYIASTFRDMHAEREALIDFVFPELRRRAAAYGLYLQEVEVQWGVDEDEAGREAELRLARVCSCHMLLGILGERYGLVPSRPSLPRLPQYTWMDSAPAEMSITEMEIRQFQAMYPDSAQERMFFFFKSPHLVSLVPVAWRVDFSAESKQAQAKTDALKKWIRENELRVTENYPCEWGGVVNGRPCVKGLDEFRKDVTETLWEALQKLFVEETDEAAIASEIKEQRVHEDGLQRQFHGRKTLISLASEKVRDCQQKGGILLVEGLPGEGRTGFMAALAHSLRSSEKSTINNVVSYSTAASQAACRVECLLRCLVHWLRKMKKEGEELTSSTSYKELLSELHSSLAELGKTRPLTMLVDGAEFVHDSKGQLVSEWIPQHIPKGVCLVLSVTMDSAIQKSLSKKKAFVVFPLGGLSLLDKKKIVQKEFGVYGMTLNEPEFTKLQVLLTNPAAANPHYLHLACEELRSYTSFEKMKDSVHTLPRSLCALVQHRLIKLQSRYGEGGLNLAMAALAVSSTGLRESEFYFLLNLCSDLSSIQGQLTWQEVLHLARKPNTRVAMLKVSQVTQVLRSLIPGSAEGWTLTCSEVKLAFEQLFLSSEEDRNRAHLVLSALLWVQSDPLGKNAFLHCDSESLAHLLAHLMKCGQREPVRFLLSSYDFLYANVRHGLLPSLLESYSLLKCSGELERCHAFLKRHSRLLFHWPALFVQQALNDPPESAAHAWALGVVKKRKVPALRWLNNAEHPPRDAGEVVSTLPWRPSCMALSPEGNYVAVGTDEGTLHIFHPETRQNVQSVESNCDGFTGCLFLEEDVICTTSYNGQVEVWDISCDSRIAHVNAHSKAITGCDVSADRKHFATVSLDFTLKVWSSKECKQVAYILNPSPLNCVTFQHGGALIVVGCWDAKVRVWNWQRQEERMTLSGHRSSVRSVSFSRSSSFLFSGSLDGEVRLWSFPNATCVGCYQAHHGATLTLSFLPDEKKLLSAGHDGKVQLLSTDLGCCISVLGRQENESQLEPTPSAGNAAALCVAIVSGFAAVGYQGKGLKLFDLQSGLKAWSTKNLHVSVSSLLWLDSEAGDLLLCGTSDHSLWLWKMQKAAVEILTLTGTFGVQKGAILALVRNNTHVASASDDCTIALWLKSDLASDPWVKPIVVSVLRGHSRGVTCLAFSPNGEQLLSGGKDQALMVWNITSNPPSLYKSFPHCHDDWITGSAWTPTGLLSCSNDCRVRLWDIETGRLIKEVLTTSSLRTMCFWGEYAMVGSTDGFLLVWKSDMGVMAKIPTHQSCLHHCTVISKQDLDLREDNLLIASSSEDGTVKLWHPLQLQNLSTLYVHKGAVRAVMNLNDQRLFTVSDDNTLRVWNLSEDRPVTESSSAVGFLEKGQLIVCGYSSGRLELWHHTSLVYSNKISKSIIQALTAMPDKQFAVSCSDCSVTVWKLDWEPHRRTAGLLKVATYTVESPVCHMLYNNFLFGVCYNASTLDIFSTATGVTRSIFMYDTEPRSMGIVKIDVKSACVLTEYKNMPRLIFFLCLEGRTCSYFQNCEVQLDTEEINSDKEEEEWEEEEKEDVEEDSETTSNKLREEENEREREESLKDSNEVTTEESHKTSNEGTQEQCENKDHEPKKEEVKTNITAIDMHKEFLVCGDDQGHMWFNQSPNIVISSAKRKVHRGRITALCITDSTIISASHDQTVKLWDRYSKKQVGMFVCGAPVEVLEVNKDDPSQLVCGDSMGQVYFLFWNG